MSSQNLHALSMKRTDDRLRRFRFFLCDAALTAGTTILTLCFCDQFADSLLHLTSSFVGECDRQDSFRRGAIANQICDPKRHHPGLACARPGQDQHRTTQGGDRLGLRSIQSMIFCVQSVLRLFVGAGLVCKKSSNGCIKPQKCLAAFTFGARSPAVSEGCRGQ